MTKLIKRNYKLSFLFGSLMLAFSLLYLISCNQEELINVKKMPKIEEEEKGGKLFIKDIAYYFAHQKSFNSVPTKVPTDIKLLLWDNLYAKVDYYFFRRFNNWFHELLFDNGMMSLGQGKESLDCENYAMLYKSIISAANYKSGENREIAVGLVVVRQDYEFAGIPASGGLHMLNLVMTTRGWYIFEPQTKEFILLEDYPNQESIQYIIM